MYSQNIHLDLYLHCTSKIKTTNHHTETGQMSNVLKVHSDVSFFLTFFLIFKQRQLEQQTPSTSEERNLIFQLKKKKNNLLIFWSVVQNVPESKSCSKTLSGFRLEGSDGGDGCFQKIWQHASLRTCIMSVLHERSLVFVKLNRTFYGLIWSSEQPW